jgi:hypothetical protein
MRDDLIGDWRAELEGVDLLYLEPVVNRFGLEISLRGDGTASWKMRLPGYPDTPEESRAPFPMTWDVSSDRVLAISIPIPPMPQYEMPDWSWEAIRYDILAVSRISLGLSDRGYDGESVIVLKRINAEEYERRQVQRYREALSYVKGLLPQKLEES